MKLRIVDIDLFLDYKLRQNKGARGQRLPYVKYLPLFTTRKGAAIRAERRSTGEPIGHMAIAVFYDLLAYSTGCHPRGVLADSEGGFSMEWLASEIKCPVDVLRDSLALLVRYEWLADDDGEIQPAMATSKVVAMPTKPQDVSATPWGDVANKLIAIWRTKGPSDRVCGPAYTEDLLQTQYGQKYELGELILQNAANYFPSHPKYCLHLEKWIKQDSGTVPRESTEAARETAEYLPTVDELNLVEQLLDDPTLTRDQRKQKQREYHAAGRISKEYLEHLEAW